MATQVSKEIPKYIHVQDIKFYDDLRSEMHHINKMISHTYSKKCEAIIEQYGLTSFYHRFVIQEHFEPEEIISITKSCLKKAPQSLLINYFAGEPGNAYPIHLRGKVADWVEKHIYEEPKIIKAEVAYKKILDKANKSREEINKLKSSIYISAYNRRHFDSKIEEDKYMAQYKKDFESFTQEL